MNISLTVFLDGNDTEFHCEYCPDTGIDEVLVTTGKPFAPAPIDIDSLFVSTGTFPDVVTISLRDALESKCELAYAENREEYAEQQAEAWAEYRGAP